jgi:hypothetical protein
MKTPLERDRKSIILMAVEPGLGEILMLHCRFDGPTITVRENGTFASQGKAVGEQSQRLCCERDEARRIAVSIAKLSELLRYFYSRQAYFRGGPVYLPSGVRTPIQASRTC